MLLITQKLSNEAFQGTPEEWAQKRHQKQVARWEAHRSGRAAPVEKGVEGQRNEGKCKE